MFGAFKQLGSLFLGLPRQNFGAVASQFLCEVVGEGRAPVGGTRRVHRVNDSSLV